MSIVRYILCCLLLLPCIWSGIYPGGSVRGVALAGDKQLDGFDLNAPIRTLEDLNRRRLGVIAGTAHDRFTNSSLDFTNLVYFDSLEQIISALRKNDIDAGIDDLPVHKLLMESEEGLYLLPGVLVEDTYAWAVRKDDDALYNFINDALAELKNNGVLDEVLEKWIDMGPEARKMPDIPDNNFGRIIHFGVSPISPPFCYKDEEGNTVGLEIELMKRIANENHFRLLVEPMEFINLIPSLLNKNVDIIGSCFSVTPERAEIMRFLEPIYRSGMSAVVLEAPVSPEE